MGSSNMNIKAVARRAGVSTATVSRTINGSDKVTPRPQSEFGAQSKRCNFIRTRMPAHSALGAAASMA